MIGQSFAKPAIFQKVDGFALFLSHIQSVGTTANSLEPEFEFGDYTN